MSFLGGIGKILGKVVKAGLGIATGGISDVVLGVGGSLLHHKTPGNTQGAKLVTYSELDKTGGGYDKTGQLGGLFKKSGTVSKGGKVIQFLPSTAEVLRSSPVLPGGSVSPIAGSIMPKAKRRKTRKRSSKLARRVSSSRKTSKRKTTKKRTTKGRLPAFGSKAWRKKFGLDKVRKRKRRAA